MQNQQISDALTNSSAFGIYIYQGDEGNIVFANEHLADILGYEKDELLGKSLFDIYAHSKDELQKYVKARIKKESSLGEHLNFFLMSKTGAAIYAEEFDYSIDYKGKPSGLVILVDRTKEESFRKLFYALSQINQLIARTDNEEELFAQICVLLIDAVGYYAVGIGSVDENTKLFKLNYLKSKSKELENTSGNIAISVDPNVAYGRGSVSKAYETGKVSFMVDVLNDTAMAYWHDYYEHFNIYSACSIPIFKQSKIKYILLINDNTKGSLSQDHLHILEEIQLDISFALDNIESHKNMHLFNKALEVTHEWALITDKKGNITYANKAVSDISGYGRDELIGKNPGMFKSGYHDKEFYEKLWHKILKGEEYSCRFVNRSKDGSLFYLDAVIVPIIVNGKIERFVDLSRDVTDIVKKQKQMELQSKIYSTLYHMSDLFIKGENEEEFFKKFTDIFLKYMEIDIVFIAQFKDNVLSVTHQSVKEIKDQEFAKIVQRTLNNPPKTLYADRIPFVKAFKNKKIYLVNDLSHHGSYTFKTAHEAYDIGSCCALPIIKNNKSIGSLVLISKQKNIFNAPVYKLLNIIISEVEFILNKFENDKFARMMLTALDTGFEFVGIADENFNIVYVNNGLLKVTGLTKEELIGRHYSTIPSHSGNNEILTKELHSTLMRGEVFSGVSPYKTKDNKAGSLYNTIVPFKINGKIKYYIAVGRDITNEKALTEQVDKLLYYDDLTGLPNRISFEKDLERFIKRASYENVIGAVAVVDPLSFGSINKAFGFEIGNNILKQISQRLKDFLRDYDIVAKLESDRFGIVIGNLKQEEDIVIVAMNLLSKLKKPYEIDNSKISLSFVMGLSIYPQDGNNAKVLFDKSQIALLDAKTKGENTLGFFKKDLETKVVQKLKLKADLESAFKNKEFILYYQPYVDKNLDIAGAESLLRWKKDDKIIPPMEFIPYLEETDLIIDVEDYVFDTVIAKLKKIQSINPIPISVNLSCKSLNQSHLAQQIASKLASSNLSKNLIGIEIIERSFMENLNNTKNLMEELKAEGVYFSIDDFGTGYSSLSYLSQLTADYIKIDISFVRKMMKDKHTKYVVESIIFLTKKLNMKTIAEGVETEKQFKLLKDMGCDYFQGYLFYKPMPEDEFEKALKK